MAGQGTIGVEIVEDMPDVDALITPFGGGGLTAGVASAVRALKPATRHTLANWRPALRLLLRWRRASL